MSCGVGRRRGSDLVLLGLWCRSAGAALMRRLAWELTCATGAAIKKKIDNSVSTLIMSLGNTEDGLLYMV